MNNKINKKWFWAAGLSAVVVPVLILTGCVPIYRSTSEVPAPILSSPSLFSLSSQQEGIWVNGQGKVTVIPDIAIVSLGVEVQAETVSEAQSEAAAAMDMVMNSLTGNGVAKQDIQTQYFNISKVTAWDDKNQQEVVLGYRVTNTVNAKVRDITNAGAIIDDVVLAAGDLVRINNISFSVDDPTVYYEEAREKSIADAKNKAEQLASLAEVKLGKPTYIAENIYYPAPVYWDRPMMEAAAATPATPISPGEMDITLNIQISYAVLN